ncbi:uncharacterized protein LOC117600408 [Osmia lignaria lignaria]|uniref:uncharacterized protein LOC117600408 n=1 Tax=Osmia lignaria lignaria TaxID=1437193 RepID=UPI0014795883|nr:uncharacterized protein LOC117600408 [Osmia lignaria]
MSDFDNERERCDKCGVVLTRNHICVKWARGQNEKKPRRSRSKRPSPRKGEQPENKSSKFKSIETQTDAVANSCVSVATQTDSTDVESEDETIKEFTKTMYEQMASQRRTLLDLEQLCTKLKKPGLISVNTFDFNSDH